jgi:hypothetical protein
MSLLQELLIKETAAAGSTGAGAIANARGSLFGGGAVDLKAENRRKTKMMRRIGYVPVSEVLAPKQSNTWKEVYMESADQDSFDQMDVISKLDDAERKAKADKDTVCFGLEDEEGGIVKVYVRADQADDFEAALAQALAAEDEDENDENTSAEIAEVLFNLKDKFDIVDVEWGVIEGDEEEEQEMEGGEGELDPEADMEGGEGELEGGELEGGDEMVDDTADATSALQSVIDVMKADAEAREAEANAKKAEADAETAKYAASASAAKVEQEEQILDMEAHEKKKSDAEKEAKTLAKLAKYQHEKKGEEASVTKVAATDDGAVAKSVSVDNSEEEESSKDELAALLLKHIAHNE